jgi:hypothetical protein
VIACRIVDTSAAGKLLCEVTSAGKKATTVKRWSLARHACTRAGDPRPIHRLDSSRS